MKRIKLFFLFMIILLILGGCNKRAIIVSDKDNYQIFVNAYYSYQIGEKEGFVAIDLRTLNEYSEGHFKGFINYDYSKGTDDELITTLKGMYNNETVVFLIDDGNNYVEIFSKILFDSGYKNIYLFKDGYNNLVPLATNDLFVVTGSDDCGC